MAKSKNSDGIDDIELLNIHRYPDSVPASVLAFVRNSRACQKRLEELLKVMPSSPRRKGSIEALLPQMMTSEPEPETQEKESEQPGPGAGAPPAFRPTQPRTVSVWERVRKSLRL